MEVNENVVGGDVESGRFTTKSQQLCNARVGHTPLYSPSGGIGAELGCDGVDR